MTPDEFLTLLWGPQPPGLIQTWQLEGRRSGYYRSPYGTSGLAGHPDVYTGVSLAHKDHGRYRRANAAQAAAIAGLWLDIDVNGGPENKTGAAADLDTARKLARAIVAPTILVHSGYGLQAWWLLPKPWRFTSQVEQDQAATMAAQWHQLHERAAANAGFRLDSVHDLARLMRLPGTINAKGGGRAAVEVLDHDGPRHELEQLHATCETAGPIVPRASAGDQLALPDVQARAGATPPAPKLQALIINSSDFAATWRHQVGVRANGWSLSEYDLSLCSQAAQAGFTDQELADLIAYHRRLWDPADEKGGRLDYLRRTIAKAREGSARDDALTRLRNLAGPTPGVVV